MSGRTDPPDWLDELYQDGNDQQPPAGIDASIRAAARGRQARPWYLRTRTLASAATIVLGLGIAALWTGEPEFPAPISEPAALSRPGTPTPAADLAETADAETSPQRATQAPSSRKQAAEQVAHPDRKTVKQIADRTSSGFSAEVNNQVSLQRSASTSDFVSETELDTDADEIPADEIPSELSLFYGPPPANCNTVTLLEVGSESPYRLCTSGEQRSVSHADCEESFLLADEEIDVDRESQSLLISDQQQRSRLRCNPQTGTWIVLPLPAPPLEQ